MERSMVSKSWLRTVILAGFLITAVIACFSSPTAANQPPVADAEPESQTVFVGELAWFTGNMSYDPDGYIVSYDWDFGDGTLGSGVTVSHAYTAAGNYTVTLTVTDDEGATDTDTVFVIVLGPPPDNQPPVALFTYTPPNPIVGEEVTFDASGSYDPDGYIVSYQWDFDDGSTGSGMIVTHIYLSVGEYEPTLTVTDDDGATDYYTTILTVTEEEPQFAWIEHLSTDKLSYCTGEIINTTVVVQRGNDSLAVVWEGMLTLEVYDSVGNLVFTDSQDVVIVSGGGSDTLYFEFVLNCTGNYTIRAILTGMFDVYDVKETYIIVVDCGPENQPPSVTIDLPTEGSTVCHSHGYVIQGSASDDDEVELVQVAIDDITIWFDAIDITDRIIGPDGPLYTEPWTKWAYSWDTTEYEDGWHTIYARAWDGELHSELYSVNVLLGCEPSGGNDTDLPPVSIIQSENQTIYAGDIVYFDGSQSYDHDGYIVSYEWDFGDGTFGNGVTTTHVYTIPGNYTVTLMITDDDDLKDTDTAFVLVEKSISDEQPPIAETGQYQNNIWRMFPAVAIIVCGTAVVLGIIWAITFERRFR